MLVAKKTFYTGVLFAWNQFFIQFILNKFGNNYSLEPHENMRTEPTHENKRTNPNERIKTSGYTTKTKRMSQHKGEMTGWYVSKELPGRCSNPKNILREYFLGYFVGG